MTKLEAANLYLAALERHQRHPTEINRKHLMLVTARVKVLERIWDGVDRPRPRPAE